MEDVSQYASLWLEGSYSSFDSHRAASGIVGTAELWKHFSYQSSPQADFRMARNVLIQSTRLRTSCGIGEAHSLETLT